jgi:iron complex transport system ATP-binding protein
VAAVVELRGIQFVRQGKPILHGIDWRVERGGHWALLGANGSGKTTLLKLITGYEWPTSGEVRVLGHRYGAVAIAEVRNHIGWVSAALQQRLPNSDVAEDVVLSGLDSSFGLYRAYTGAERERARAALAAMGAAGLAERTFGTLSQGEQQRVVIARALIAKPSLLILDEPCAGLDPVAREHFLDDLDAMVREAGAPTLILVTHHVEEIRPFIAQVLVLADGEVLAQGPVGETLIDGVLSQAFGQRVSISHSEGRYTLQVLPE